MNKWEGQVFTSAMGGIRIIEFLSGAAPGG